jgi:SAM-dependent methyltransferase/uncharacterized protein YbaR (Trm112 family)
MKADLLGVLACPDCEYYPLEFANAFLRDGEVNDGQIVCQNCGIEFNIIQGVPVLLATACNASAATARVEMRKSPEQHKQTQVGYFNNIGTSEFEITRPHNTGRLYQALLDYKAEQSLRLVRTELNGAMVLCVCCGSGMDLEYLQDRADRVVGMDISIGAVLGARERARRFGLEYDLVVGDAERLPFRPNGFDFGYVHDGLHHLASPYKGLCELWRASRRAIVLTEPTDAFLTRISVLLGISGVNEEAGNKVRRLEFSELKTVLAHLKPASVSLSRYLMWYPHQPPSWFEFFNRDRAFRTYWYMFSLLNRVIGQWGNKLTATIWKRREVAQ